MHRLGGVGPELLPRGLPAGVDLVISRSVASWTSPNSAVPSLRAPTSFQPNSSRTVQTAMIIAAPFGDESDRYRVPGLPILTAPKYTAMT